MFDVHHFRAQFPALARCDGGRPVVYLDGPGGTQVPRRVIDAMVDYLTRCNANHGGLFRTSRESDEVLRQAHEAVADLLNATSADEVVFGQNMTSLTFHLSRSIGQTLKPGDEVIVTRLDHDANVTPWVLMARDAGATVRWVDVHPEDCTLDLEGFRKLLGPRTRLVAVGCASNAVGTVNDVGQITAAAHDAGARVFLDAVHYAPHGPIDVQRWGCDFLACSAYKFFGPHVGILWGKREHLERLPAYKVRPASDQIPDRWMTGTQNHEGLAGVRAAVDYLATVGEQHAEHQNEFSSQDGRRLRVHAGLAAIRDYEQGLSRHLLRTLGGMPAYRVWGITQPARLGGRVPTVAITHSSRPAGDLARHLAEHEINVWSGNMYALGLTERLGLEDRGGVLRIGLVHYNTADEIDRLTEVLGGFPG